MDKLILFCSGFIPGIIWLTIYYKKDIYEPEPIKQIIKVFAAGLIVVIPVAFIENILTNIIHSTSQIIFVYNFLLFFIIVGPVEEYFKFLAVVKTVYNKSDFNEPLDGIIYSCAASMGFASIENAFYVSSAASFNDGLLLLVMRGFLSTAGHLFFGAIWGFQLGKSKFKKNGIKDFSVKKSLVISMFFHGLYDFVLISFSAYFSLIIVIYLLFYLNKQVKQHILDLQKISPFKPMEKNNV